MYTTDTLPTSFCIAQAIGLSGAAWLSGTTPHPSSTHQTPTNNDIYRKHLLPIIDDSPSPSSIPQRAQYSPINNRKTVGRCLRNGKEPRSPNCSLHRHHPLVSILGDEGREYAGGHRTTGSYHYVCNLCCIDDCDRAVDHSGHEGDE